MTIFDLERLKRQLKQGVGCQKLTCSPETFPISGELALQLRTQAMERSRLSNAQIVDSLKQQQAVLSAPELNPSMESATQFSTAGEVDRAYV